MEDSSKQHHEDSCRLWTLQNKHVYLLYNKEEKVRDTSWKAIYRLQINSLQCVNCIWLSDLEQEQERKH